MKYHRVYLTIHTQESKIANELMNERRTQLKQELAKFSEKMTKVSEMKLTFYF